MRDKIFKTFISLLLLMSLCFNTMAAIVSDNDGSAFITKAEFESLKKEFNSQIDNYNASIDLKIDGAIAAYLAGLINKKTQAEVINRQWKEVTAINGVLENTYKVPSVDLQFLHGSQDQSNTTIGTGSNYWDSISHFSRLLYQEKWAGTIKNCYRNLVHCTGANPTAVGDIIWDGQAIRYNEKWNISRMVFHTQDNGHPWAWADQPGKCTFAITMRNFSTLKEAGWVENNWDDKKNTSWPIGYKWEYTAIPGTGGGTGSNIVTFRDDEIFDNFRTSVTLDKEGTVTKRYEHIVSYKGESEWRISNPEWPNYINTSPESSIKSSDLKSTATLDQQGRIYGVAHHNTDGDRNGLMQDFPISHEITDDSVLPSLGLFTDLKRADAMYQDNVKENIDIGNNTIVLKDKPKLNQGFQLLAAKENDEIDWTPIFNYTHVHDSASTYKDNDHEVDIYFSNGPFTDDVTTSNIIQVTVGSDTTKKDYATTTDLRAKIKFTMPETGLVYVKWVPHDAGTYLDSDWLVTLDLQRCNTYTYFRP